MQHWTFGPIEASTTLPAQLHYQSCQEDARTLHTFTLTWKPEDAIAASEPAFTLFWMRPIVDMQYQWHSGCGFDRTFRANWSRGVHSKLSSGSPLHCFFNDAGYNRYTVALSDCVTDISRQLGVREENANLECRIVIPLDGTGRTDRYEVTLWIDETDCRYEEAIGAVARWWETFYPPMRTPQLAKQPMYSTWYSYHQRLDAREIEEECARAWEIGMKTVLIDDGWQTDDNSRGYAFCGDWQVARSKIPDMRAFVEHIHRIGMKCVVWYSVPFVGIHSEAIKRFEGKTLMYLPTPDMQAYTLDPRYPEVREYLRGIYVQALRDWDLDGFKLDFIDSFRMGPDTPAFREGMDCVVLEDGVHRLMVEVMEALTAIKPDILIEFRQSYIGPVMREFGNMFRVGDCPNTTATNRVGMVDLRLTCGDTAVHGDPLVWNVVERVETAVCHILNSIFATMQLSVQLARSPEDHLRAIRFWTKWMFDERDLLLSAPLRAENPQTLYPCVRTEKDGRSIIGCYQKGYLVELPASRLHDAYILNASSAHELLVRFDEAAVWALRVYNCMGELVREESGEWGCGLCAIDVPECGFIRIEKV